MRKELNIEVKIREVKFNNRVGYGDENTIRFCFELYVNGNNYTQKIFDSNNYHTDSKIFYIPRLDNLQRDIGDKNYIMSDFLKNFNISEGEMQKEIESAFFEELRKIKNTLKEINL